MTQKPFQFTKRVKRDFKSPVRKKNGENGNCGKKKSKLFYVWGRVSLGSTSANGM